jgi:hypothetical protein
MRKHALLAEKEVCFIFYISINIEARDSNKNQIVPRDMDYNSYYYKFLLNSLPVRLINL